MPRWRPGMWYKHRKRRARGRGAATTQALGDSEPCSRAQPCEQGSAMRKTYAVADGQIAVGCVVPVGASRWRAIDHQGRGRGIFKTLKQAVRALPTRGEP